MSADAAILEARDIVVLLGGRKRRLLRPAVPPVQAVAGVSLSLRAGETLGLVGEFGLRQDHARARAAGHPARDRRRDPPRWQARQRPAAREARAQRRAVQYVHQDAGAALDPWWSIGRILEEGLIVHSHPDPRARRDKIDAILDAVGLDRSFRPRYVHELSGGQLRRVALARILLLEPRIVILDEPTSGLDLSVQATVLSLIADLKARLGLTYLIISHDLSVVERMCDRVAIMYLGRIVEAGPARAIFEAPRHPYTRALLAAAPRLEPGRQLGGGILEGEPPSPRKLPSGCAFRTRCPHAAPHCADVVPALESAASAHDVACLRWREIASASPSPHFLRMGRGSG